MKKSRLVLLSIILIAVLSFAFAISVSATEKTNRLTVEYKNDGDVSVYVGGVYKGDAPIDIQVPDGQTVKILNKSDDFLFFTDAQQNTVGESNEYIFTITKDTYVCAWNKLSSADKTIVVYRNTNSSKQVLSYATYKNSEIASVFVSHKLANANKFGYDFSTWNKSIDAVSSEAQSGNGILIVEPLYVEQTDTFTVSVVNGKISGTDSTSGQYKINSYVNLVADEKANKTFKCWTDSNGIIISDQNEISVPVVENQNYTARYDDYEPTVSPKISLYYEYYPEDQKIRSYSQRFLPNGYTLVSYGLVYAKNSTVDLSKLYLDKVDQNEIKYTSFTNSEHKSGISMNWVSALNGFSARAYLTYADSEGTISTVYSDAIRMVYPLVETNVLSKEFETDTFADTEYASLSYSKISSATVGKKIYNGKITVPIDVKNFASLTASMSICIPSFKADDGEIILYRMPFGLKTEEDGEDITLDWNKDYEGKTLIADLLKVVGDGNLYIFDENANTWVLTSTKLEAGKRYKFLLQMDINSNLVSLYVNDVLSESVSVSFDIKDGIQFFSSTDNAYIEVVRANVKGIRKLHYLCDGNHQFVDTVVEANCVHDGYTLHVCNNCGTSYKDDFKTNIDAHHNYEGRYLNAQGTKMICDCLDCGKHYEGLVSTLYYVVYDDALTGTKEISEEIAYSFERLLGYAPLTVEADDVPNNAKTINCAGTTTKLDTFGWKCFEDNYTIFNGGFVSFEAVADKFEEYMLSIPNLSSFEDTQLEAQYINNYNYKRYDENTLTLEVIEKLARDRAEEIMNTPNTDVSGITGRVFYFSSINGDDSYPENTIDTPWKTITKLNYESQSHTINKVYYPATINSGDAVLFERGSVYRDGFKLFSGLTYGCYGDESKAKPTFLGSRDNFSTLSTEDNGVKYASDQKWVRYEGNIWKLNLAEGETKIKNPGFMVFVPVGESNVNEMDCQNIIRGDRYIDLQIGGIETEETDDDIVITGLEQLTENFRFYNGTLGETTYLTFTHSEKGKARDLYVYYDGDLNADFSDIEIAESGDIFSINPVSNTKALENVVIDNFTLKYTGTHGFNGGGRAKVGTDGDNNPIYQFPTNITIQNCVMCWIGGSVYACWGTRDGVTRYGNAVQIYGGIDGFYVQNNWIYQIYDTGVTVQFNSANKYTDDTLVVDDIHFNDNVIESTYWSVEFWAINDYQENGVHVEYRPVRCELFELARNIFNKNYSGWGSTLRPDVKIGATISISGTTTQVKRTEKYMYITDNIIGPSYIEGKSGNDTRYALEYMGGKTETSAYRTRIYAASEYSFGLQYIENNYLIQYDDQNYGRVDNSSGKHIYYAGSQADMDSFFASMGDTVEDDKEYKFMLIHRVIGNKDLSDYDE